MGKSNKNRRNLEIGYVGCRIGVNRVNGVRGEN